MKKLVCFVLGLLIGVTGTYYFGIPIKEKNKTVQTSTTQNESTDLYEYIPDILEVEDDAFEGRYNLHTEPLIDINAHFNRGATLYDDIGFPIPSQELIDSYDREGDGIIYDMQDNGKGILINYYGIGMNQMLATIFITSDHGKNWEIVKKEYRFLSGPLDVIYIGDTIIIVNSNGAWMNTGVYISNDNGKTFNENIDEEGTLAQFIGESPQSYMMAFPIVLSKDTENNTILCAWCNVESNEILVVCEHNGTTFKMVREFYRDNDAISNLIKFCN